MGLTPIPPVSIQGSPPVETTPIEGLQAPEPVSEDSMGEVRIGIMRLKAAHELIQTFIADNPETREAGRVAQDAILQMLTRFTSARTPDEPAAPVITGG